MRPGFLGLETRAMSCDCTRCAERSIADSAAHRWKPRQETWKLREKRLDIPVSSGLKEFWRTASSVLFVRSGPYFALLIAAPFVDWSSRSSAIFFALTLPFRRSPKRLRPLPRVHAHSSVPFAERATCSLLERIQSRKIPATQLELLATWLDTEPEVPEGEWYRRFSGMTVCGEGELNKTFLLPGQAPKGKRVP